MTEGTEQSNTQFIITVDTETYALNGALPPFDANIYGNVFGKDLGVGKIMEICDRYQVKATFFVDVYMHYKYGKAKVNELCRLIHSKGHDVQLHAHTSWLPGSRFGSLSSFPLERQADIIAEGADLIGEAIGKRPVAFRAGAYTANLDTIRALEQNDFLVDSSYFAFHTNCILSRELQNVYYNAPFRICGILEIPVTTYCLIKTHFWRKLSKIDVNSSSLSEMCDVIPKLIRMRTRYVVLFLHSFSFIRWKNNHSAIIANDRAIERFEAILDRIASWGYQARFGTMEQVAHASAEGREKSDDSVPLLKPHKILSRLFQRAIE